MLWTGLLDVWPGRVLAPHPRHTAGCPSAVVAGLGQGMTSRNAEENASGGDSHRVTEDHGAPWKS